MINPLNYLKRPEYIFRPEQALRRIARLGKPIPEVTTVELPWGAQVSVHTNDHVGGDIFYFGIFDKIVPETLWRLADPGEMCLDIGANIGQNTSLLARKTGSGGSVVAFEPHPEVFAELKGNVSRWPVARFGSVRLENCALGASKGEAVLDSGTEFSFNRGSASINPSAAGSGYTVRMEKLDDLFPELESFGVCKLDVEGYEIEVLRGAERILRSRRIRDLVFEEFAPEKSEVIPLLESAGYTIFKLVESWLRPGLRPLSEKHALNHGFSGNYLASVDPNRALNRFAGLGWKCLTAQK